MGNWRNFPTSSAVTAVEKSKPRLERHIDPVVEMEERRSSPLDPVPVVEVEERHSSPLDPVPVPVVEIEDVCRMGLRLMMPEVRAKSRSDGAEEKVEKKDGLTEGSRRRRVGVAMRKSKLVKKYRLNKQRPLDLDALSRALASEVDKVVRHRMEKERAKGVEEGRPPLDLEKPRSRAHDEEVEPRLPGPEWLKPERWTKATPPTPAESSLLDVILRHHYRALALLCKDKDADYVHGMVRGMVLAGYAYGLEQSPVDNIITNARWYIDMFPAKVQVKVRMLGCRVMLRLACRSFNALVAFMATYAPALTPEQILAYLTSTGGHLLGAIQLVDKEGITHAPTKDDAFRAAILAARLPDEAARQAHLRLFVPNHESAQALDHKHQPAVVLNLESPPAAATSTLSRGAYRALSKHIQMFRREEQYCLDMVHKALQKLEKHYELHMICGNHFVSFHSESVPFSRDGFYHVNFLASPGGNNVPTLFFAEVQIVYAEIQDVTLCCPVTEQGQKESGGECFGGACAACEGSGMKLIHPADRTFHGQLHYSKCSDPITNEMCRREPTLFTRCPLREDYLFFEADRHPDVANFLEAIYSGVSDDRVDRSFIRIE